MTMRVPDVREDELRAFVDRDYGRLVAGLTLLCGSGTLAEDAVQEATARAVERMARGETIQHLNAWVAVVSRNLTRSWLRRVAAEWRAREKHGTSTGFSSAPPEADRLDLLAAIGRLRPRQREAIALFYFADLPVAEVARAMRLHPEAVKGLLHRARASLAELLDISKEEDE